MPASHHGKHRLAAVLSDDLADPIGHQGQGLVPGRPPELAASLAAGPDQRVKQPVGVIDPIQKAIDLRAKLAAAVRMVRIAAQLDRDPVLDGCHPAAAVRAVVMTRSEDLV